MTKPKWRASQHYFVGSIVSGHEGGVIALGTTLRSMGRPVILKSTKLGED